MSGSPGTIEVIAGEIAKVFIPLEERIKSGQVLRLMAELGIQFPQSLASNSGFSSALSGLAGIAGELPNIAANLAKAIKDDDYAALTKALVDLATRFKNIIDHFDTVATAIDAQKNSLPGLNPSDVADFASALPGRLADYLLIRYVEDGLAPLAVTLDFFGIFKRTPKNVGSTDPNKPPYLERELVGGNISEFLKSPPALLQNLYGWGGNSFDGKTLLKKMERLALELGLPAVYTETGVPTLDLMFLEIKPKTDINPKGLILLVTALLKAGKTFTLENDPWKLEFGAELEAPVDAALTIQPNGTLSLKPPAGDISGEIFLRWSATANTPEGVFLLFGELDKSHLVFEKLAAEARVRLSWNSSKGSADGDFSLQAEVKGGKLLIDLGGADSFIGQTVGASNFTAEFDLAMGFSTDDGFYFNGSSALEVQIPIHLDLNIIEIESITLSAGIKDGKFPVGIGADLKANLGPLKAVVEDIGVNADLSFPGSGGNMGPLDLSFGFRPPKGVGLSVDAGIVKGGGYLFLDHDKQEYAGALELIFSEFITLKAIGLITTRMPDGSKGFSLLIIITAEFGSGFQLGFGFTLLGVGGLLGLNRTMRLEPLAEGVRTGAINGIMFPTNVVENAPRIISDLRNFFPVQEGTFLIGPMAKIGWGTPTLVSLSLGIIIEIPGNIAILGVLKVVLPDEAAALLVLQVNFIGAIEFDKKRVWFYAVLFESRVLFNTLEGGMGLLVAWGKDANFVVSVGGFHPAFNPPPLPFPEPNRIGFNILQTPVARIRVEGYFAVTSNTVQFGARVELFFGFSSVFKIEGHLGFDALFQFSPFYMIIQISASLSVKVFGIGLFSVRMRGSLEGPTPWHVEGTGSISLLFWDIDVDFSHTWGDEEDTTLPPIEVIPLVVAEFDKLENWKAELSSANNLLVSLRPLELDEDLVLHPVGTLKITQRAIPLDLTLDRVGAQKPSDANKFTLSVDSVGIAKRGDINESFAMAQFKDMDDSKKLSSPAFESQNGGLELSVEGQQLKTSQAVKRVVRYETIIIDTNFRRFVIRFFVFFANMFLHFLKGNAVSKSTLSHHYKTQKVPFSDKIEVKPNTYGVAQTTDNAPFNEQAVNFTSQAAAQEFMQAQIAADPNLADSLHVIPEVEMKRAA